jgi:hypothetical protein
MGSKLRQLHAVGPFWRRLPRIITPVFNLVQVALARCCILYCRNGVSVFNSSKRFGCTPSKLFSHVSSLVIRRLTGAIFERDVSDFSTTQSLFPESHCSHEPGLGLVEMYAGSMEGP